MTMTYAPWTLHYFIQHMVLDNPPLGLASKKIMR